VVIKELGDEKLSAGVDLGSGAVPVHMLYGALNVPLRICRRAQAEFAALLDESNQIHRVAEAPLDCFKRSLAFRGVAAQGENVFQSHGFGLVDFLGKRFAVGTNASEVSHGLDTVLSAQTVHDAEGCLPSAATGTVGHGDKGSPQSLEARHRVSEQS